MKKLQLTLQELGQDYEFIQITVRGDDTETLVAKMLAQAFLETHKRHDFELALATGMSLLLAAESDFSPAAIDELISHPQGDDLAWTIITDIDDGLEATVRIVDVAD